MNPNLTELLIRTDDVMNGRANGWHPGQGWFLRVANTLVACMSVVDLGTAYTVLTVLDENYRPIAGAYQFAQVVRDGLVVDFVGAVALLHR